MTTEAERLADEIERDLADKFPVTLTSDNWAIVLRSLRSVPQGEIPSGGPSALLTHLESERPAKPAAGGVPEQVAKLAYDAAACGGPCGNNGCELGCYPAEQVRQEILRLLAAGPAPDSAPTCPGLGKCPRPECATKCVIHGTQYVRDVSIPIMDALTEPCKGCGKRPIDFMEGAAPDSTPSGVSVPTHRHADGGLFRFVRKARYKTAAQEEWSDAIIYEAESGNVYVTTPARWADHFTALPPKPGDGSGE